MTAAWLGTVPAAVIGGVGTLVVAALWARLFPALFNAQTIEEEELRQGGRASTSSADRGRPSTSSG